MIEDERLGGPAGAANALADWFLGDFAQRAQANLGVGSDCSITLRRLGEDRRAASSSEDAGRCDDVENHAGEGACIRAMDAAHVVLVRDLSTEGRWPAWTSAARDAGYRSAAAFPATVGTGTEIAFHVYSQRRDPWTGDVVARGDLYARQIADVMRLVLGTDDPRARWEAFQRALAAQAAIDQAVGAMTMCDGCTAAEALDTLRDDADRRQVELSAAAAAYVRDFADGRPGSPDRPSPIGS